MSSPDDGFHELRSDLTDLITHLNTNSTEGLHNWDKFKIKTDKKVSRLKHDFGPTPRPKLFHGTDSIKIKQQTTSSSRSSHSSKTTVTNLTLQNQLNLGRNQTDREKFSFNTPGKESITNWYQTPEGKCLRILHSAQNKNSTAIPDLEKVIKYLNPKHIHYFSFRSREYVHGLVLKIFSEVEKTQRIGKDHASKICNLLECVCHKEKQCNLANVTHSTAILHCLKTIFFKNPDTFTPIQGDILRKIFSCTHSKNEKGLKDIVLEIFSQQEDAQLPKVEFNNLVHSLQNIDSQDFYNVINSSLDLIECESKKSKSVQTLFHGETVSQLIATLKMANDSSQRQHHFLLKLINILDNVFSFYSLQFEKEANTIPTQPRITISDGGILTLCKILAQKQQTPVAVGLVKLFIRISRNVVPKFSLTTIKYLVAACNSQDVSSNELLPLLVTLLREQSAGRKVARFSDLAPHLNSYLEVEVHADLSFSVIDNISSNDNTLCISSIVAEMMNESAQEITLSDAHIKQIFMALNNEYSGNDQTKIRCAEILFAFTTKTGNIPVFNFEFVDEITNLISNAYIYDVEIYLTRALLNILLSVTTSGEQDNYQKILNDSFLNWIVDLYKMSEFDLNGIDYGFEINAKILHIFTTLSNQAGFVLSSKVAHLLTILLQDENITDSFDPCVTIIHNYVTNNPHMERSMPENLIQTLSTYFDMDQTRSKLYDIFYTLGKRGGYIPPKIITSFAHNLNQTTDMNEHADFVDLLLSLDYTQNLNTYQFYSLRVGLICSAEIFNVQHLLDCVQNGVRLSNVAMKMLINSLRTGTRLDEEIALKCIILVVHIDRDRDII